MRASWGAVVVESLAQEVGRVFVDLLKRLRDKGGVERFSAPVVGVFQEAGIAAAGSLVGGVVDDGDEAVRREL